MNVMRNTFLRDRLDLAIEHHLEGFNYLKEPALSEVVEKPHYMINYDGIMYFIIYAELNEYDNVDWKTLRIIEMIFEIKIYYGNNSIITTVLKTNDRWKDYCVELLRNFSDNFYYDYLINRNISDVRSKQSNFELWDLERRYINKRRKKLRKLNLEDFTYQDISGHDMSNIFENMMNYYRMDYYSNFSVRNLKNHYLSQDRNLKFYFDYCYNENNLIELKSYKKFRISYLQNLLIKSRLIRYKKFNNRIVANEDFNLFLFINSDLKGPLYDQERYARMLIESGWNLFPFNSITEEVRFREVFNL